MGLDLVVAGVIACLNRLTPSKLLSDGQVSEKECGVVDAGFFCQIAKLLQLTERYCVVYQTLRAGVPIEMTR